MVVVGEILKQDSKYNSYFADAVNRELRDIKLKMMMVLSVMMMMMLLLVMMMLMWRRGKGLTY